MNILDELKLRGIIKDVTNLNKFKGLGVNTGVYIGFDPSAPSLHLGNYVQITILNRFKQANFKVYAVVGGATGMIGDPSGKSMERNLLDDQTVNYNKLQIKKQLNGFGLTVIDNLDFYKNMSMIAYLRDVGKLLNVNYMLSKEMVKNRLDEGISYSEFSYQLIQGWDFKILYEKYGIKVQIGGSDQWGNITSGLEIIRKTIGDDNHAVGMTVNLLTDNLNQKFGKSAGNALWLNPNLTSPYDMYQYLFNADDASVIKYLHWLTFLDLKIINNIINKHNQMPSNHFAQESLAFEVVKDIHGLTIAQTTQKISRLLFGTEKFDNLSIGEINSLSNLLIPFVTTNIQLIDLLVAAKIATSKRDARELINNKAIHLNNQVIENYDFEINQHAFPKKYILIQKGKKKHFLIKIK